MKAQIVSRQVEETFRALCREDFDKRDDGMNDALVTSLGETSTLEDACYIHSGATGCMIGRRYWFGNLRVQAIGDNHILEIEGEGDIPIFLSRRH